MDDSIGDTATTQTDTASWRFAEPSDAGFLYDLAVALDPRIWRFSKHGTAPFRALETVGEYEIIAVLEQPDSGPFGFAGLVDLTGDGRCAQLDLHTAPVPGAADAARSVITEVLDAAFANGQIQHLYIERFDDDPDLIGHLDAFRLEVEIPEFAFVGGRLASRLTYGLSRDEYLTWFDTR
ncbi:MAG: hypothetical protein AAFP84_02145 [Actinomycetota bacterium]